MKYLVILISAGYELFVTSKEVVAAATSSNNDFLDIAISAATMEDVKMIEFDRFLIVQNDQVVMDENFPLDYQS